MDVDRSLRASVRLSPDLCHQGSLAHHFTGPFGEGSEQIEFLRAQIQAFTRQRPPRAAGSMASSPTRSEVTAVRSRPSPKQGPHPCFELGDQNGLTK